MRILVEPRRLAILTMTLFVVEACFFELADPVDGSAEGGVGGRVGDASDGPPAKDAAGGCGAGEKVCGDPPECVPVDDPRFGCSATGCEPCSGANAALACAAGRCALATCPFGFGDCDRAIDNGCETEFDAAWPDPSSAVPGDLVLASRMEATAVRIDGHGDEWQAHARHAIATPCIQCTTQPDFAPVAGLLAPPKEDLTAWYRVAWDDSFLYVFAEVRDDVLVGEAASPDGGSLGPGVRQDALEIMINGNNSRERFYDADDRQLFFALDGSVEWPYRDPGFEDPNASFVGRGVGCYTFEARMTWSYVGAASGVTKGEGDEMGWVIAVNDWDWSSIEAGAVPERSSQLFSKDPNDQYWNYTEAFGTVRLVP